MLGKNVPPTFPEALKAAEEKLTRNLGQQVSVILHRHLTHQLQDAISAIDRDMFRPELRYSAEEITSAATRNDFTVITAETEKIIAISYGYADEDGYFLDILASTIEGKGVGSILAALTILYAYERGYRRVTLYTEQKDEKDRRLREWYQRKLDFTYVGTFPSKGDVMTLDLTAGKVDELYRRHLATPKFK